MADKYIDIRAELHAAKPAITWASFAGRQRNPKHCKPEAHFYRSFGIQPIFLKPAGPASSVVHLPPFLFRSETSLKNTENKYKLVEYHKWRKHRVVCAISRPSGEEKTVPC